MKFIYIILFIILLPLLIYVGFVLHSIELNIYEVYGPHPIEKTKGG